MARAGAARRAGAECGQVSSAGCPCCLTGDRVPDMRVRRHRARFRPSKPSLLAAVINSRVVVEERECLPVTVVDPNVVHDGPVFFDGLE